LITGGAGAIGLLVARHIFECQSDACVVLAGRSQVSAHDWDKIQRSFPGAHIEYRTCDVADGAAVEALLEAIRAKYGTLAGILHAAGISRDRLIANKEVDEFAAVLAPKVNGTLNLDYASRGCALDFFILFSSATAVTGNTGQSDYACANAFMDGFA